MLDLGRFPYINKDDNDKVISSLVAEVGTGLNVDIIFNNTTNKNIPIAANGATWTVVNNATGVMVATGTGTLPSANAAALAGKSINLGNANVATANLPVGSYTLVLTITSGTTTYDSELPITIKPVQADADAAQLVINEINALGSNPTKAAVQAARTSYNALNAARQALVTNLAKLVAFENDILAGQQVQTDIGTATSVGDVKALRTDYNALGNLGKAEVTLADIVAAETALTNAKTALANAITTAEGLYNAENARLDTFSAADIIAINGAGTDFNDYLTAVRTTFKGAITTAKAIDVNADATLLSAIDATTLNNAITAFNSAKATFDTLPAVVATGK